MPGISLFSRGPYVSPGKHKPDRPRPRPGTAGLHPPLVSAARKTKPASPTEILAKTSAIEFSLTMMDQLLNIFRVAKSISGLLPGLVSIAALII